MNSHLTPHTLESNGDETSLHFFRELEIEFLLHELKDPLAIIETGVRSLLEKRQKYGDLSARQEKTLDRTLRNTRKVQQMLNGLLEIGRSEAGQFTCRRFQPARTLYTVLADTLETVESTVADQFKHCLDEQQQLDLLADYGVFVHLTPQMGEAEIVQDEVKFHQILGNLTKNALYHRQARIDISMRRDAELLWIEVSDDGPGIEPEHQQAIFRRYTQLEQSPALPRKGHGLGLAGALIMARCLGGNIEVSSMKGQGATFRLMLPVSLQPGP